ncbi:hypothetical protein LOAG_00146 [Loa loa]|uniref:Uncharacterized protein n=1 Tax=Loa loa TaxID=7209 RepID=A0A1S0UCE4_LOALO|nr:hypothetical protein LOAG_00146 [Loa loa]EFO28327.1 hypothetical protein LOAG_00146 [Loa loa]
MDDGISTDNRIACGTIEEHTDAENVITLPLPPSPTIFNFRSTQPQPIWPHAIFSLSQQTIHLPDEGTEKCTRINNFTKCVAYCPRMVTILFSLPTLKMSSHLSLLSGSISSPLLLSNLAQISKPPHLLAPKDLSYLFKLKWDSKDGDLSKVV